MRPQLHYATRDTPGPMSRAAERRQWRRRQFWYRWGWSIVVLGIATLYAALLTLVVLTK